LQTEAKRIRASSYGWLELDYKILNCGGIPQGTEQQVMLYYFKIQIVFRKICFAEQGAHMPPSPASRKFCLNG
jgi:hypothetical protein